MIAVNNCGVYQATTATNERVRQLNIRRGHNKMTKYQTMPEIEYEEYLGGEGHLHASLGELRGQRKGSEDGE